MPEDANPATLDAAITWVNHCSWRQDAVSRLGLDRPGDGHWLSPLPAPPQPLLLNEAITQVLRGQERLMTTLAKLDLANTRPPPRHSPRPPPARTEPHANDMDNEGTYC